MFGSKGSEITLLQGDTEQRHYQLGIVSARTLGQKTVDMALRRAAASKGADAVVKVQYSWTSVGVSAWGTAIRYGNPALREAPRGFWDKVGAAHDKVIDKVYGR